MGFSKCINTNLIFGYFRERLLMNDNEYEPLVEVRFEKFYSDENAFKL